MSYTANRSHSAQGGTRRVLSAGGILRDAVAAQPLPEDGLRLRVEDEVEAVEPAHLLLLRARELLEAELRHLVSAAARVRARALSAEAQAELRLEEGRTCLGRV